MDYVIREINKSEYPLLEDFLYEAIFIPPGASAPPRSVLSRPEIALYIERFGELKGDCCVVALVDGSIVGAAWARIIDDYGHIDDETPSLAISLYKEYRSRGIGTALMRALLARLASDGYKRASLSVQKDNYAVNMYKTLGFGVYGENDEDYIMVCGLDT